MASTRRNPRGHQRIAVSLPDGRLIEYVTDGKGRRIGKMVNGVLTKQWIYRDQLKPAAELDGTGNIISEFIYGTKTNLPDLVVRGGSTYRIVGDQLGSPVLAINTANSSDVPFQATYAAFGERALVAGTDDWIPFGFAGGHYDADTKLTRFGARDYDARFGRWISKDPIRFKGTQTNIYVYAGNDPINRTDPTGRDWMAAWKGLGADILDFFKDILGLGQCSNSLGHYQDLEKECNEEIKEACSGPCWLDNPTCGAYGGGVDKDSINKCILNKDPNAWNDMMNNCMSL